MSVSNKKWISSHVNSPTERKPYSNARWAKRDREVQPAVEEIIIPGFHVHSKCHVMDEGITEWWLAAEGNKVSRQDRDRDRRDAL